MLKQLWKRTCAFDAEWVACPDSARRLLSLPAETDERTAMEALWRHYAKEEGERPFLKLALSRVVSVAAVMRTVHNDGQIELRLASDAIDYTPEGALIGRFLESVATNRMQLWGFNSSGADLPLLVQRAIALGVSCPAFARRPDKPWEGPDYFDSRNSTAHIDILQAVAGYARGAAWPTLDEFAAACGVPGKLDTSGKNVADLYLAGDVRGIAAYNEADALTTHLLMLRIGHFSGQLSDGEYGRELGAVEELLQREIAAGRAHLRRFWATWRAGV